MSSHVLFAPTLGRGEESGKKGKVVYERYEAGVKGVTVSSVAKQSHTKKSEKRTIPEAKMGEGSKARSTINHFTNITDTGRTRTNTKLTSLHKASNSHLTSTEIHNFSCICRHGAEVPVHRYKQSVSRVNTSK